MSTHPDVSISHAKDQLPRLIREAEAGAVIPITRRGQTVAVLISHDAYRRMIPGRGAVWQRFEAFRTEHNLDELGLEPHEWLADARSLVEAREVSLE